MSTSAGELLLASCNFNALSLGHHTRRRQFLKTFYRRGSEASVRLFEKAHVEDLSGILRQVFAPSLACDHIHWPGHVGGVDPEHTAVPRSSIRYLQLVLPDLLFEI